MEATDILQLLRENRVVILWILAGTGLVIYFISGHIAEVRKRRAFEESRREIAAYLAEGTITPEAAAMLLSQKPGRRLSLSASTTHPDAALSADQRLAKAVNDSEVDEDDARRLIDQRAALSDAAWAHAVDLVIRGMNHNDALRLAKARPAQPLDKVPDSGVPYPPAATPFVGS